MEVESKSPTSDREEGAPWTTKAPERQGVFVSMDPDPNDVANLNQEAAFRKLREWGYPITRRTIKDAFDRRELKPLRLGNGNYTSINDLLAWIESRRLDGGPYRVPEKAAAAAKS